MPPARSIASYFVRPGAKLPSPVSLAAPVSTSAVKSPAKNASGPTSAAPTKSSGLSDATASVNAKRAASAPEAFVAGGQVEEEEPAKKKRKVESVSAKPVVVVKRKAVKASKPLPASAPFVAPWSERATGRAEIAERIPLYHSAADVELFDLEWTMGEDWLVALQDELFKPYFLELKKFLAAEQQKKTVIFPAREDIYSWSRLCPLKEVRVVIIGQDPYHDDGQAHGLAFSVRPGVKIPPSLRNMYKEMTAEIPGWVSPKHGDLREWAKHGVLLLNTALTVRAHEAGSHSKAGWDQFTAAVLRVVTDRLAPDAGEGVGGKGVVFMAWGAHAAKMCAGVDNRKHLILKSAHPSPLSASRGFFGNGHFLKANEWLEERYGLGGGIDWKSLGAGEEAV